VQKTYRYDEGGKKTLVYEFDDTGKLTVYDPNDNQAKQMLAHEKRQQQAALADAARMDKIRQAPKRKQNDPIYLYLQPVESEIDLTDKQKSDIFEYFRKQFENDPVIRLVSRQKGAVGRQLLSALKGGNAQKGKDADVNVVITVSTTTVYGFVGKKVADAKALVFKARIAGNWLPAEQKAEETGTLFQLPDATRRLSDRIKQVIKQDIGPTIPADRSL
jgi:hypothetical protein